MSELKKNYYFDCDCSRCKDDGERLKFTAMACSKEGCDGYVQTTDEKCKDCDTPVTDEQRQNYEDILDMTRAMLEEMGETRYIDVCRNLVKKQRGVLHKRNIWHLKTVDLAFEAAIDFEAWEEAVEYGKDFIDGLR